MNEEELKVYIQRMKYLEYTVLGLPKPDITLVLSVKPVVSYENILKRGRETDENETLENLTKSYINLQKLCELEGYVMVDCCKQNEDGKYEMLSREEITEKAWEALGL
jgi:thymidylate kinase